MIDFVDEYFEGAHEAQPSEVRILNCKMFSIHPIYILGLRFCSLGSLCPQGDTAKVFFFRMNCQKVSVLRTKKNFRHV